MTGGRRRTSTRLCMWTFHPGPLPLYVLKPRFPRLKPQKSNYWLDKTSPTRIIKEKIRILILRSES